MLTVTHTYLGRYIYTHGQKTRKFDKKENQKGAELQIYAAEEQKLKAVTLNNLQILNPISVLISPAMLVLLLVLLTSLPRRFTRKGILVYLKKGPSVYPLFSKLTIKNS